MSYKPNIPHEVITTMNNPIYNSEAFEANAKAALNNATQAFELSVSKSVEILEKNFQVAKETIERQTSHINSLRDIRDFNDLVQAQETFSKQEMQALENFSKHVYQLANEAAADLAVVSENQRNAAGDLVSDSLETVAQSLPSGGADSYSNFLRDTIRTQISAFKTFNNLVDKTIAAQRANFSTAADAVNEVATTVSTATGRKYKKKK